jgi:hypothetical protein
MTRTENIQQHFIEWKNTFFQSDVFYEDGIINEELYATTSKKILFIAKEPNGANHEGNETRSFCDEWNKTKPTYGFALRIAEWSYGILNNFPPFSAISLDCRYNSLKKIAFLNCKKSHGGGVIGNINDFHKLVFLQQVFIKRQIEIIEPEIVILSLSHSKYLRDLLFPQAENNWIDSGYQVEIAKTGKMSLIDFYHPSSRNVPAASYSLLQNVIRSDAFIQMGK